MRRRIKVGPPDRVRQGMLTSRSAELRVKVHAHLLSAKAETDDMITAMTGASDKIIVQLKKFKGKLKEKDPSEITELTNSTTRPDTDVDGVDV